MVEVATLGTLAGFGAVTLTVLGFAWNVASRGHDRIERELFELRRRMREVELELASLRPLRPLADRVAGSYLEDP